MARRGDCNGSSISDGDDSSAERSEVCPSTRREGESCRVARVSRVGCGVSPEQALKSSR
jgi:hypothetical protein